MKSSFARVGGYREAGAQDVERPHSSPANTSGLIMTSCPKRLQRDEKVGVLKQRSLSSCVAQHRAPGVCTWEACEAREIYFSSATIATSLTFCCSTWISISFTHAPIALPILPILLCRYLPASINHSTYSCPIILYIFGTQSPTLPALTTPPTPVAIPSTLSD